MKSTRLSLSTLLSLPVLPQIFGAADGDGDGQDAGAGGAGNGQSSDNSGGDGGGSRGADSSGDDKSKEGGDPQKKIAALEEEKDRHHAARTAAEKERDDLKAWKEEQVRKSNTELENTKLDVQKRDEEITALKATNRRLLVNSAFYANTDVEWHNPARALTLVDLTDIEIDEKTGVVKNPDKLKAAIKKLADDEPYLVKPKGDANEADDKSKQKTGDRPSTRNASGKEATRKAELQKKYPGLRQH